VSQGAAMARLVDLAAHAIRPIASGIRVFMRPTLRLWRLASLRSQTKGSIPVTTQFDGPVMALGRGEVRLGANCRLGRDVLFDTSEGGKIEFGNRVRVNSGGVIVANVRITIGDDTLIGEYVSIRDANHGSASGDLIRTQAPIAAEISVGRDVWIGRGCCLLPGITIGNGAVVGANSVVIRDVPSNSIYAGVPAKQIGSRTPGTTTASTAI
jgi:acetyltransferase-like isoleucine patch superfamily enzyme